MKTPIYQVIENDLKNKIKRGELAQGDMIPSENELKDMYGISRMTVRQALNNLVNEGYIYRHKGKGTFVGTTKIEKKIQGLHSFTEQMKSMNRTVSNRLVSLDVIPADDEVAAKLFINKGDEVYCIKRVRYGDDIPVLYEELHVPKRIMKEVTEEMINGSFYHYLEHVLKLKLQYAIQSIEAKLPSTIIAQELGITKQSPVLFITLNTFLDSGRPIEYAKAYYRADQYRFIQHAFR
ncbi:MAG: GntR family transcriptional regulator [Candidatus Izemoplasmataceae bacterium]|jgi:GntR family transcriptional regulator|uniref:GntR family transcriptional regulator n=1 Tax=Liberiplasma polymorphum TaxID=3374570 RepID=UPI003773C5B4